MATITEDYVSFEVAKLLKEKGFPQEYDIYHSMVYNEEDYEDEYEVQRMVLQTCLVKVGTLSSYPASVPEPKCYCPTHQMAMKWLREEKDVLITYDLAGTFGSKLLVKVYRKDYDLDWIEATTIIRKTLEEAVDTAIRWSLENLVTNIGGNNYD